VAKIGWFVADEKAAAMAARLRKKIEGDSKEENDRGGPSAGYLSRPRRGTRGGERGKRPNLGL